MGTSYSDSVSRIELPRETALMLPPGRGEQHPDERSEILAISLRAVNQNDN